MSWEAGNYVNYFLKLSKKCKQTFFLLLGVLLLPKFVHNDITKDFDIEQSDHLILPYVCIHEYFLKTH